MSDEILRAIESSNAAFGAFKANIEERFANVERLEAKMYGRIRNGTMSGGALESGGEHGTATPETKAFLRMCRTGNDAELKAMSIGSSEDGGYSVPRSIAGAIEVLVRQISPMRQLSTVLQTSTSDFHQLVSKPGVSSSGWVTETQARSATDTPVFEDIAPTVAEIYSLPLLTQTVLDDSQFNLEAYLTDYIATEFAVAQGTAFCTGNGVGKPMGLLNYPTAATADATRAFGVFEHVKTGSNSGWAATTATASPFDVLQSAFFAMKPAYRKNSAWLMNSVTACNLAQQKDTVGRFVTSPSQVPGNPPTILGLPVYEDPNMPAITTQNALSIALVNPRAYLIVDRIPLRMLRDPFSSRPYVGLYTTARVAGCAMNTEAAKFVKTTT